MLKLDNNGYIRHLIRHYTSDRSRYTNDLCGVIKGVILSLLTILVIIVGSVAIICLFFGWVVPLLAYNFTSGVYAEPFFQVSLGMLGGAILLACIMFLDFIMAERRRERKWLINNGELEMQPSILAVWYDGFKNKYCPRVEFVDKDEAA